MGTKRKTREPAKPGATHYTTHQAAEALNLHPASVRRYLKDGRLEGAPLSTSGRVIRISRASVERLLNQGVKQ